MDAKKIMQAALAIQPEIQANRRELHRHPELGMDLAIPRPLSKQSLRKWAMCPRNAARAAWWS